MEVAHAILAVYAEVGPDGRLYMHSGDLDTLRGAFPGPLTQPLYLAIKLLFAPEECDRDHQVQLQLLGPNRAVIDANSLTVRPPRPDQPGRDTKIAFVAQYFGIHLPAAGAYSIRVAVDDTAAKVLPLYLENVPRPGQPA